MIIKNGENYSYQDSSNEGSQHRFLRKVRKFIPIKIVVMKSHKIVFCYGKNKENYYPVTISYLKRCNYVAVIWLNPITFRKVKIVYNFSLSECNRVTRPSMHFD